MTTSNNSSNSAGEGFAEVSASFRDPSGHLFTRGGVLYRAITPVYRDHYDYAKESGLYEALMRDGLLVRHEESDDDFEVSPQTYTVIRPEKIPFISYPYEWCFSQLKDAALLTLEIQKRALDAGMILKDASAFNIQFKDGKPILIDTLSFEKHEEGSPWIGYRQFCQHFLAPLALMSYKDVRLGQFSRIFIDGIPLDFASTLLPFRTFFRPLIASHIHLHAKSQKKFATSTQAPKVRIGRVRLRALIESLESSVKKLHLKNQDTEWQDYYGKTNYSSAAFVKKQHIVSQFLKRAHPETVWDLGANTGVFSRSASEKGISTVSFDIDPVAVESNYLESKRRGEKHILPLVSDLTNPSAGIGWANEERASLEERGPADTILALALVHHLAISNNVPFRKIAAYFSRLCQSIIIEFVPKSDSQVRHLLATRKDIFTDYNEKTFEEEFNTFFSIAAKERVAGTERTMYLMHKK